MDIEKLEKANNLAKEIEKLKKNISRLKWYNDEEFIERSSFLKLTGINENVEIPKSLFKIFVKMTLSECNEQLRIAEEEFESL